MRCAKTDATTVIHDSMKVWLLSEDVSQPCNTSLGKVICVFARKRQSAVHTITVRVSEFIEFRISAHTFPGIQHIFTQYKLHQHCHNNFEGYRSRQSCVCSPTACETLPDSKLKVFILIYRVSRRHCA